MAKSQFSRIALMTAVVSAALLQAACGGGGDGVGSGGTGIVSGVVTKGPVANATVNAYGVANGQLGAALGSATTDANGNYSVAIGSYSGPVMLQVRAGTYQDEATGNPMTLGAEDFLTAVLPPVGAGAASSGIQVTPVTSMAQARAQQMPGGMTEANIAAANAAMGNYFAVGDILHVAPMNPLVPGSAATASAEARNYGMALAAMSQYALSQSMTNSSALVTSMMSDASDGIMDGRRGANPIAMTMGGMRGPMTMQANAGSVGLATAMTQFAMSPANLSGLGPADVAPLAQKMSGSGGRF